jgi:LacI family transcriptional regulator
MMVDIGLKDVANRAGVSTATASNALSGARPVAEITRQRVFDIAEEFNYRPNLVARGLRLQKTRTIALLVNDISNPYYPAVARAVHDRIGTHGYASFIGNIAAETVPIALIIGRESHGLGEALGIANLIPKQADTMPAVVGALIGSAGGVDAVPRSWRDRVETLRGLGVRSTAGVTLRDLTQQLIEIRKRS